MSLNIDPNLPIGRSPLAEIRGGPSESVICGYLKKIPKIFAVAHFLLGISSLPADIFLGIFCAAKISFKMSDAASNNTAHIRSSCLTLAGTSTWTITNIALGSIWYGINRIVDKDKNFNLSKTIASFFCHAFFN